MRSILANLKGQTRQPDEVIAVHSGIDSYLLHGAVADFWEVRLVRDVNRQDWGHNKRAIGLLLARKDYVGFFNDDDKYDDTYIDAMMKKAEEGDHDAVYCGWNNDPSPQFMQGSCTSGNFLVKRRLAIKTGGWAGRHYEADGQFIDQIAAATDNIGMVEQTLYFLNEGVTA